MIKYLTIPLLHLIVITFVPLSHVQVGVARASCTDRATFVNDVSIPDSTRIKAGESFEKT